MGITGDPPDWFTAPADMCEDQACGQADCAVLCLAAAPVSSHEKGAGAELTK